MGAELGRQPRRTPYQERSRSGCSTVARADLDAQHTAAGGLGGARSRICVFEVGRAQVTVYTQQLLLRGAWSR